MSTIHVHIHRRAATRDAGFEESKHKRDAGGKFTAGGMTAAQHSAKSDEHAKKASEKGFKGEGEHHFNASESHFQASRALGQAEAAHKEGRMNGPNSHADWMSRAENHVKEAAGHAAKIAPKKADSPANVKLQLEGRKQQLAELQKDMKTGKYSSEDMKILKEREASLQRMIGNYEAKGGAAEKPAKHSPVMELRKGGGPIPGYTTTPTGHPYGTNVTHPHNGKQVPGKAVQVHYQGAPIGTVQSYSGHVDGPKIGGRVVAWRKDVPRYSGSLKGTTESTYGNATSKEAVANLVLAHQRLLRKNNQG